MTRKYFGTDGIRGCVGEAPITADFMLRLGNALGQAIKSRPASVVIGKDTRISGYMFESALEAGLSAAGVNTLLLGPMPTPAIAYLTRTLGAEAGIVISASHNAFTDNGIKFFNARGEKLSDELEITIEQMLTKEIKTLPAGQLGKAWRIDDASGRYIEYCKSRVPDSVRLDGLKVVIDCAHGATYHVGPLVFQELGAEVIPIHVQPDGMNINKDSGSTSPEAMRDAVLEHQADLGIAFDGDGDRLIMVDKLGRYVDGDQILYVLAKHRLMQGNLDGGVVGTIMSNLGMENKLKEMGVAFVRSNVGDRYVHQELDKRQWVLGGEASGHMLILDRGKTGDGIVTALLVLEALISLKSPLDQLVDEVPMYPQITHNVRVNNKFDPMDNAVLAAKFDDLTQSMAGKGRLILRASGTEPIIRVTAEAQEHAMAQAAVDEMADLVRAIM